MAQTLNLQTHSSSNVRDFRVKTANNSNGLFSYFTRVVVHEFGHLLELSHPDKTLPYSPVFLNDSNMRSTGSKDSHFLRPWDSDCVDDANGNFRGERTLKHVWAGFDNNGNKIIQNFMESDYSSNHPTQGTFSGGWLYGIGNSSVEYFSLYQNRGTYNEYIWKNGQFKFSDSDYAPESCCTGSRDLPSMPTLMTPVEFGIDSFDNQRLNYTDYKNSNFIQPPTVEQEDYTLPKIKHTRSEDRFDTGTQESYKHCGSPSNSNCISNSNVIQSHIPFASAWDEASGNTIFVSVDTSNGDLGRMGEIDVYPGFAANLRSHLRFPSRVASFLVGSFPSTGLAEYNFTGRTDRAPAITCANTHSAFSHGYNCMLFWIDNGDPLNNILYTYFKINTLNKIEWRGSVYKLNASSISHLSAAYFADKFWIAWKTPNGNIKYRHRTTGLNPSWSITESISRGGAVITPPSWFYVPHKDHESALVWTEDN